MTCSAFRVLVHRLSAAIVTALVGAVLVCGEALAVGCGTYNSNSVTLDNISWSGGDCIILTYNTPGANIVVDFFGAKVECTNAAGCGVAIKRAAGANPVIVEDSSPSSTSGLKGKWSHGLENATGLGIRIDGASVGVFNQNVCGSTCFVRECVILNCGTGIYAEQGATGLLEDNYIVGTGSTMRYGIDVSAVTGSATLSYNYIRQYWGKGVRITSSVAADHTIIDRGTSSTVAPVELVGGGTATNWDSVTNICEDAFWCPLKNPPFFLP